MSKNLYFINDNSNNEKKEKIIDYYDMKLAYEDKNKSIFKNPYMLMEVERKVITVIIYNIHDYALISKIRKDFANE